VAATPGRWTKRYRHLKAHCPADQHHRTADRSEPVPDDPNQRDCISRKEVDILLDEYYALHGWDSNGIHKVETLQAAGLEDVAARMPEWACHRSI
jgi:aldehyde:ferredoxin oxidoreductase